MATTIYSLFLLICLTAFFRSNDKKVFIALLPACLLIFDSGFSFFGSSSIITYSKGILIFLCIFYNLKLIRNNLHYNAPIFIFFVYGIFLLILSEELSVSIKNCIKVFPPLFFFFIGVGSFKRDYGFRKFLISISYMVYISFVFGGLGYVFDIGQTFDYGQGGDVDYGKVGLLQGGNYYPVSISMIVLMISIMDNHVAWSINRKRITVVTIAITYLLIILTMRRTAIALPLIGFLIVAFLNFNNFKKILFYALIVGFLSSLAWPIYGDLLEKRYSFREKTGRFDIDFYQKEARYIESQNILNNTLSFNDIKHSLIGSNIFAGGWEKGVANRMFHTDHGQIIATTGLIGFIIYFCIYVKLISYYFKFRSQIKYSKKLINLNSLLLATIAVTIAAGLNGSVFIITFRVVAFLTIGALIGKIEHEIINRQMKRPKGLTERIKNPHNFN